MVKSTLLATQRFISTVGGVETIADLENGDVVRVYAEKDSDGNLNIVMIGFDGIQEIFSTTQVTADASVNAFTVSATFNNGVLTVTMSKDTISDNADQFNLIITYADGTFETINTGVRPMVLRATQLLSPSLPKRISLA